MKAGYSIMAAVGIVMYLFCPANGIYARGPAKGTGHSVRGPTPTVAATTMAATRAAHAATRDERFVSQLPDAVGQP